MPESDFVVINGKRYISAKKASDVTGYTNDYIGQLCRAGKLPGKVFKHRRFVEEASLFEHAKNIGGVEIAPEKNSPFARIKTIFQNFKRESGGGVASQQVI